MAEIDMGTTKLWQALVFAEEGEQDGEVYHALNDLAGLLQKYGVDRGLFSQILEEYF